MNKETETRTTFERSAALFMAFVSAISLLATTGWLFNQHLLASFRPEFIPMAPSTALIFLGLCGAWLIHRIYSARRGMRILVKAGLVGMLIIVFILELRYFTEFGPDLEQMLFPNPTVVGVIETAHISPLTALGFFLAIPAFFLLTGREPGQRTKSASAALSLVVFILSGLIILSYLYGAPPFYGGTLIPVAVTTALSFLFLSLGLLMTAGPACWPVRMYIGPSLKARFIRAFIPASIVIVLLQGLFSTASAPWIVNPALRVAVAALMACLIFLLIISIIAQNLSTEIERSNQARMTAEATLNQSEARFRTLAETANDAIINIDRDGHIVFWNRAAETIFGYSAGEVSGKPLDMIIPMKFYPAHHHGLQRVVMTGETRIIGKTVEVAGLRKDGREFPLSLSLATWQVGGDVFFTGIIRDISERKQAEEALQKSASSLQAVLQSTADGIMAVGIENEVLYASERFAELWRIPPAVMASKDDGILLKHVLDQLSDPQSFLKKVQELYKSKSESFDTLNFKDGRVFERLSRPLMQGEVALGRVWSFRDITERKQAEEALRESENRFRKLFEQAAVGVALLDTKTGHYLDINQKYCDFLGYTKEEMLNLSFQDVTYPDNVQENIENSALLLTGKISEFSIEKRYVRKDGNIVWGDLTASPLWRPGEEKYDYLHIAVVQDITERKQNELIQNAIYRITQAAITSDGIDALYHIIHAILGELIPAENFFIAMYDAANELISFPYFIDQHDEPTSAPTPIQGLTGYVIRSGRPLLATREVFDRLVQQGEVEAVGTVGVDWLGVPLKIEGRMIGVMAVQSYTLGVHFNQQDMDLLEFVSTQVAQAIERKRLEEEIRSLSLTDELTGLYNRRGFTLLAEREVTLAHRSKVAMLLLFGDVDNLKTINDTWGHAHGDLALKEISTILKQNFRESDILARIGGDEFVVLAVDGSKESTEILTNRLEAALETRNQVGDETYHLSLSLGVARYDPKDPRTVSELIAQADGLMYQQKQAREGKK